MQLLAVVVAGTVAGTVPVAGTVAVAVAGTVEVAGTVTGTVAVAVAVAPVLQVQRKLKVLVHGTVRLEVEEMLQRTC